MGATRRAQMESGNRAPTVLAETERYLDEAIVNLRTAGYSDYTVRGSPNGPPSTGSGAELATTAGHWTTSKKRSSRPTVAR
jgi:hypothetical protein